MNFEPINTESFRMVYSQVEFALWKKADRLVCPGLGTLPARTGDDGRIASPCKTNTGCFRETGGVARMNRAIKRWCLDFSKFRGHWRRDLAELPIDEEPETPVTGGVSGDRVTGAVSRLGRRAVQALLTGGTR